MTRSFLSKYNAQILLLAYFARTNQIISEKVENIVNFCTRLILSEYYYHRRRVLLKT